MTVGSGDVSSTFSGVIQEAAIVTTRVIALTKTGTGTLTLSGANTHGGTTNINDGILRISNASALGDTSAGTSLGGGTSTGKLELSGGLSFAAESVQLAGRSTNAVHLSNLSGNNTWNGAITTAISGNIYSIESQADKLTIAGNISVNQTGTRVLNLSGAANGEVTGIISGSGSNDAQLVKAGAGTWTLSNANTYTGTTTISGGTLLVNGDNSAATGAVSVNTGTLGGTGTVGGAISVAATGTLAPGTSIGTLTAASGALFVAGSTFSVEINTDTTTADLLAVSSGAVNLGNATLSVAKSGAAIPADGTKFTLASYAPGMLSGQFNGLADGAVVSIDGLNYILDYNDDVTPNTITLTVDSTPPSTPYNDWATDQGLTAGVNDGPGDDPDADGRLNIEEFAFDGNPLSTANDGKVVGKIGAVGGDNVLTLTLPVRVGATFSGSPELTSGNIDGVSYTIQGTDDLIAWDVVVTEVAAGAERDAIQAGLPALSDIDGDTNPDWEYRTFRTPDTISADPVDFIRAKVESAP